MRAAQLGTDCVLRLEVVDNSKLRAGGVVISVLATTLPSFTEEVLSGRSFQILPELPTIPGVSAIGIVEEVASDVFNLQPGQMVCADPQVYCLAAPG